MFTVIFIILVCVLIFFIYRKNETPLAHLVRVRIKPQLKHDGFVGEEIETGTILIVSFIKELIKEGLDYNQAVYHGGIFCSLMSEFFKKQTIKGSGGVVLASFKARINFPERLAIIDHCQKEMPII